MLPLTIVAATRMFPFLSLYALLQDKITTRKFHRNREKNKPNKQMWGVPAKPGRIEREANLPT